MEDKTTEAELSDKVLIEMAKADDEEAFEQLFHRYKQKIARFVFQFVGAAQIAEDITQQTFIKVYRNLDKYQPSGTVSSWIYRIASNQAKDELRKLKRRPTISLNVPVNPETSREEKIDTLADERQRPDYLMREREMLSQVKKALEALKPRYKEVLLLCDYEGMSYEEAAEVAGITKTNVSAILCRARKMLAKEMKG